MCFNNAYHTVDSLELESDFVAIAIFGNVTNIVSSAVQFGMFHFIVNFVFLIIFIIILDTICLALMFVRCKLLHLL